jgi:hypothetical protein
MPSSDISAWLYRLELSASLVLQAAKDWGNNFVGQLFHLAEGTEHVLAEGGEAGSSAFRAALGGFNKGAASELSVHRFDKVPGALAAHADAAAGRGN